VQCVVVNAHVAQYDSDFFPGTPNDIPFEFVDAGTPNPNTVGSFLTVLHVYM